MNQTNNRKEVPELLSELGELYRNRNAIYGSDYKTFGKLLVSVFPKGLTLNSENDWTRFALFMELCQKISRYGKSFKKGGHVDSLDDLSVYAQMLQEVDEDIRVSGKIVLKDDKDEIPF